MCRQHFLGFPLAGYQHIQIEMQRNPQYDIDNDDVGNVAVRQQ